MKEAFGGISNLVFIVVFLTVIMGALALTVSYTKAFHMKNEVIQIIEEYETIGCLSGSDNGTACKQRIIEAARKLTYNPPDLHCGGGTTRSSTKSFCYSVSPSESSNPVVVTVVTQVDMSFPIVTKITGMRFFQVAGDTKKIKVPH